jgi:uncharacterized protein YbbC (DUF1343 family)
VLVFDVQDVGARYYTYTATMALCMRAARKASVRVLVLDRPNPIGGVQVEGGGLEPGLENFCGLYPVPQRHGMTSGELARLCNTTFGIGCDLEVVSCEGWRRAQYFDETDLPWVMPSPNMPTLDTAIVYPGMCLLEATNLSEGRGTTRPFELFGAPFVDGRALAAELESYRLSGVILRPCTIEPAFHKHARTACGAGAAPRDEPQGLRRLSHRARGARRSEEAVAERLRLADRTLRVPCRRARDRSPHRQPGGS